jgi:hypothetical protein
MATIAFIALLWYLWVNREWKLGDIIAFLIFVPFLVLMLIVTLGQSLGL